MTRKQYACIKRAISIVQQIKVLAINGQDVCENYNTAYFLLDQIERLCNMFLDDFEDTEV